MKHLLILVTIVVAIFSCGCLSNDTQGGSFSLEPNQSHTIHYNVDRSNMFYPVEDKPYMVDTIGYTIETTDNPGTYSIKLTTDAPNDVVEIAWKNTMMHQKCDKFSCNSERVTHWSGIYQVYCIANRNSDCEIENVILDNATEPVLEVWISGKGSGNITVHRKT